MTFQELFNGVEYTGTLPDGQAALVTQDSRKAAPGAVFVCVKGRNTDGHSFAEKAIQAGASVVVAQRPLGLGEVLVQDSRAVYARLCGNFFDNPAQKLVLVAVTGTNGKTTVAAELKQVLQLCERPCGLIGTIRSEIGDMEVPARFTTPEAWDLNALLARMVAAGCTHVVMEASSQALEQGRVMGFGFALAVFTNLTQDHLDYHGTMEEYYRAKKILFSQCDAMLVNGDDDYGRRLLREAGCPVKKSFSVKAEADFAAKAIELGAAGVDFMLQADGRSVAAHFPMPGGYSASNALAVVGGAIMLGVPPAQAVAALGQTKGVTGRCEVLYNGDFTVICDFAHTADAIENLLGTLRPFAKKRMVVLYGCAGDRDAAKRPAMSRAVAKYADEIFLTSDNPRTEKEQKIFDDALPALVEEGKPYTVEPDRAKAVALALDGMQAGDMLVLCGKGHEDYQVLNGVTLYLSEHRLVADWVAENKKDME